MTEVIVNGRTGGIGVDHTFGERNRAERADRPLRPEIVRSLVVTSASQP
jgi:hypothetical protein